MTYFPTYRKLPTGIAVVLLAGVVVAPLAGLPPPVGGIPVWYQDTFFYAWMALGVAGVIAVVFQLIGYLCPVRWNFVDVGVLILCLYMTIRTSLMDFIPQAAWIQIVYLAGSYGVARILWTSVNTRGLHLLMGILLIAGILEALYGLGQLYGFWPSHHKLFSLTVSFFNPGPFSGWLACVIPVAVYGTIQKKDSSVNDWVQYLSWSYLFLTLLVLIPATSRAAFVAAGVGSIVVLWTRIKALSLWSRPGRYGWMKYAVVSVVIIGLAGLYLMKKDSADGRLFIYKVTGGYDR